MNEELKAKIILRFEMKDGKSFERFINKPMFDFEKFMDTILKKNRCLFFSEPNKEYCYLVSEIAKVVIEKPMQVVESENLPKEFNLD